MSEQQQSPPLIGIIGGIGPQASARLHRVVVDLATQRWQEDPHLPFPEVLHYSVRASTDFSVPGPGRERTIDRIAEASILLADAGVSRIGLACNTAHLLFPRVEERTGVPIVRIPALVAAEVERRGLRRVGLLATAATLRGGLYDEVGEIAELIPSSPELTAEVEQVIGAVYSGRFERTDHRHFVDLVERFRHEQRLDAVILGCTELPVAYGEHDRSLIIDSIDELGAHLVNHAFEVRA